MLYIFIIVLTTLEVTSGSNILFVPVQFRSLVIEQTSVAESLIARGHGVTMVIGSRYPNPETIERLGIRTIPFDIPDDVIYSVSVEYDRRLGERIFKSDHDIRNSEDDYELSLLVNRDCTFMMEDTKFMERIKQIKFDLAIVNAFILSPCNLILPRHLGVPFISMSAAFSMWQIRVPIIPSFTSFLMPWKDGDRMSFLSRALNLVGFALLERGILFPAVGNTTLLKQYSSEFQKWDELIRESELFIMERDHLMGTFLPTMPNIVMIPGLTARPPKPLDPELEVLANRSKDGVILVSFGSTAHYMPVDIIQKFFDAFSQLPQTVFAKFGVPHGVVVPKNVKLLHWLPQNDILGHRNTRLFITHCGNNGQNEALYHGVPMLGFPLFAEQDYNCHGARIQGFGLEMDIHSFTSEELRSNIDEVIGNPKYRSTIEKKSSIWHDAPMTPRETAVYWVEHIIKHGGQHLRSIGMEMGLLEFLMLDVLATVAIVILVVLWILRCTLWILCKKCRQSSDKLKQH